jgi:hypothetical protein
MVSYLTPYLSTPKPTLEPIPENVKKHAEFIRHSFKKQEDRPATHEYGFYQPAYSNDLVATYYKPELKQFNIGLRGTDVGDFSRVVKDLKTDLNVITGDLQGDKQYRDAYNLIRKVKKFQTNQQQQPDINLYGFSMGGAIAKHLSNDVSGIKTIALNPLSFNTTDNDNTFTYRIQGDTISRASDPSKTRTFEVPSFYSHGIQSFLD